MSKNGCCRCLGRLCGGDSDNICHLKSLLTKKIEKSFRSLVINKKERKSVQTSSPVSLTKSAASIQCMDNQGRSSFLMPDER